MAWVSSLGVSAAPRSNALKSSTLRSATACASNSGSSRASSFKITSSLALVAGLLGTIAQYSITSLEYFSVPILRAIAMISSLLKPTSGRSTGVVTDCEMTAMFWSVCDETCPTASPVMIALADRSAAIISAVRKNRRFKRICQYRGSPFSRRSRVTWSKSMLCR